MKISKKEQELMALTSSLVPTPANLLVSQANKKAKKIQDTSGQTLLELSKSADPLGSLEKTLVDTLNSVSTPCSKTWRVKVTTQGHLLFQLHPLVHGTKGKDSGLLATPNTMDHLPPRSPESTKKLQEGHRKGRTKPSNLREQVDPATMRMYPTPRACDLEGGVVKNVDLHNGSFSRKNKKGVRYGVKLKDAVHHMEKMYPTPAARDYKDSTLSPASISRNSDSLPTMMMREDKKTGGRLNPNFVEFLMGFRKNWTKVESEGLKD